MNPHFGHLYGRPNFLHFLQRVIIISPQFGHGNFVASSPGGIMWLHDMHVGMVTMVSVVRSVIC
jgi:uncharacterized protein YigE (DUF2233 family)